MLSAQYIEVGGTLSYVESAGAGPAVLCIHTAGQSGVQWRHVTEDLATMGYQVIVADLPGHGRSEPHPEGPVTSLRVYAEWCGQLLDALEVGQPYIVGCSIGGKIALEMAVQRGDRLAGVLAMAAHGGTTAERHKISTSGLRRELEDASAPSRSDRTYLGTLAVVGQKVSAERAELIARMHRREDPEVSNSDLIGWATQDLSDDLRSVHCPVHVVIGSDDLWITAADAQRTTDLIPRGRFTLLDGFGHYPMEEMEDFARQLDQWLGELSQVENSAMTTSDNTQQPTSLISTLRQLVASQPDAPMLIDAGETASTTVDRQTAWNRVAALQQDLKGQGVGAGDCVAVWLPNWSDAVMWQFAAASLGAHVIGVNTRYNTTEVAHVMTMAAPKVIAVAYDFLTIDFRRKLRDAAEQSKTQMPSVALVTGPGGVTEIDQQIRDSYDVGGGVWVPSTVVPEAAQETITDAEQPEQLVVAFTTSGSTGMPKLAAHSAAGVLHHAQQVAEKAGFTTGKVNLAALPLSGVFGFSPAMAAIVGGAAVLLEPVFNESKIAEHMETHRVTHVVGGDDIVGRIVHAWTQEPREPSSLERLLIADLYGRANELCSWVEETLGATSAGVYGSSEVFALAAFWPTDEPVTHRFTSGGRPVSEGIKVRAADATTGEIVQSGETGELQFQGPNVVDAYLGNEQAYAESFTADGWFRTGDLGVVAEDGGFQYSSRLSDALRLRGFLVKPAEIEARLIEHQDIDSVKVVGRTADSGETEAVAFVTVKDGSVLGEKQVRKWCAETLAGFKVPRRIYVLDEMPTTVGTNGTKIRAKALREMAQDFHEKEKIDELQ